MKSNTLQLLLEWSGKLGSVFALVLVFLIFSILVPETFLTFRNFSNIIMQTVTIAIAAIGMTFIIVSAGIDLSVGSAIALTGTLCTLAIVALIEGGMHPVAAIMAGAMVGMLVGVLCGALNGLGIVYGQLAPFIVTLGTMEIYRGVGLSSTDGNSVTGLPTEFGAIANSVIVISQENGIMIPYSVFILIPVALISSFVLRNTVFGMQVYAVGSNERTARLCGVNVDRVKLFVYGIGGLTTGIAGVLFASRLITGQPSEAVGMELEVIAAVVIGGGSLMGGAGTIMGSVVGAFIIIMLRNGCNLCEISSFTQRIVIGLIIILAVYLDQLRRKMIESKG